MDIFAGVLGGQLVARGRRKATLIAAHEMRGKLVPLVAGIAVLGCIVAGLSWPAASDERPAAIAETVQATHA